MVNTQSSIDYVEIGICEKGTEIVGLFLNYNFIQDTVQIVPADDLDVSFFNLKFFSILYIKVGYLTKFEESIYLETEKDQSDAKQKLVSLTTILKREGRCTSNDFIKTNTYARLPTTYADNKKLANQVNGAIIKKSTYTAATVVGGAADIYNNTNNVNNTAKGYVYPQSKVLFIKRKTELPNKKLLKALHNRISVGDLVVELPEFVEEDEKDVVKNPNYMYDDYDDYSNYGCY